MRLGRLPMSRAHAGFSSTGARRGTPYYLKPSDRSGPLPRWTALRQDSSQCPAALDDDPADDGGSIQGQTVLPRTDQNVLGGQIPHLVGERLSTDAR